MLLSLCTWSRALTGADLEHLLEYLHPGRFSGAPPEPPSLLRLLRDPWAPHHPAVLLGPSVSPQD